MNGSVASLLSAARRGLMESVAPELSSPHARSQLAATLDILSKLERMADWSPTIGREEGEALQATAAAVHRLAAEAGLDLPARVPDSLEGERERIRQQCDWLFAADLPAAERARLDAAMRAGLRAAVAAERRHVPRTDFSAMTGAKED